MKHKFLVSLITWNTYPENAIDIKVAECVEEALNNLPEHVRAMVDKIYVERKEHPGGS